MDVNISVGVCLGQRSVLDRLVADGLMERRPYEEHPPRDEYRLTAKGIAAWDVLAAMWRFGSDWFWDEGEGAPPRLVDAETGDEIRPRVVDEGTGRPVDVRRTRVKPPSGGVAPPFRRASSAVR